jgi:hypothetical protein
MVNTPNGVGNLEAATNTTDTGETPEGRKADIVTATASCKLQAASCKLQAASCKLQAASESVCRLAPDGAVVFLLLLRACGLKLEAAF